MRTYAQQKAGLTRALKKGYEAVVAEVKKTLAEWEELPYGWPDDWSRWGRALEDSYLAARHDYIVGKVDELPELYRIDDLRFQV